MFTMRWAYRQRHLHLRWWCLSICLGISPISMHNGLVSINDNKCNKTSQDRPKQLNHRLKIKPSLMHMNNKAKICLASLFQHFVTLRRLIRSVSRLLSHQSSRWVIHLPWLHLSRLVSIRSFQVRLIQSWSESEWSWRATIHWSQRSNRFILNQRDQFQLANNSLRSGGQNFVRSIKGDPVKRYPNYSLKNGKSCHKKKRTNARRNVS